jgi:cation diffusion facilitator CzcD-associated flavoprotein CzcO
MNAKVTMDGTMKATLEGTKNDLVDVLIIGAGLSGIGAAVHLKKECPSKSFAILEARKAMGGTWDLFRYPGIRSDSDMYTLGYNFKPWTQPKPIADGEDIRNYIQEAAAENHVDSAIRYEHKVVSMNWSSQESRWIVHIEKGEQREPAYIRARYVICGVGYYRYDQGLTPDFKDRDKFKGQVIHPQQWPEDLDYTGKKVVVIGSGATAVTLVPAMTDKAAHVTMLQRSPTYVMSLPQQTPLIAFLRKWLPERAVYRIIRTRNILLALGFYKACQRFPNAMRKLLMGQVRKMLGDDFNMQHFNPKYNPWDQRLCAVPDGDLFEALKSGRASIVTDHIERFTEDGILLKSGQTLQADLIITATGLDVQLLGGMDLTLDNEPVDFSSKHYYKGAMIEDVPNMAMIFGYTNSSWTLKADLISTYFCKVINYMDKNGYTQCIPKDNGKIKKSEPFLNLSSSYVQRVINRIPKQGDKRPWRLYQNFIKDYGAFKLSKINDDVLTFSNPRSVSNETYGLKTEKWVDSEVG